MSATEAKPAPTVEEDDFYDPYDGYEDEEDRTCHNCHGTGGEPMNDGITPCEECDGEGYKWWL